MNAARVNIYGEVGTDVTLKDVVRSVPKGSSSVYVHINSVGGDVNEGYAIHNFLKGLDVPVHTIIEGSCYSIATIIALAGNERKMWPNAEFMIHNPWGMVQGDASEMERYAKWIKEAEVQMVDFYAKRLNASADDISSLMKATTFISAAQAYELGFITEPASEYKAVAKLNVTQKKEVQMDENKNWLAERFAKLEGLLTGVKPARKAMIRIDIKTEGGDRGLYVDSETEDITGKKVFLDEAMSTPAPAGTHALTTGKEIVVDAEGTITQVKDPAQEAPVAGEMDKEMEELRAMNEELKAKVAAMESEKMQAMEEKELAAKSAMESEEKLSLFAKEFTELKAKFSTDIEKPGIGSAATKVDESLEDAVFAHFKKAPRKAMAVNSQEDISSEVLNYFNNKNKN